MIDKIIEGKLVLANECIFHGYAPSWQTNITCGEAVFNTGMNGYEESLTDPSYSGQILVLTYPILGNYGVSDGSNWESNKIHVKGVVCQTLFEKPQHHQQKQTLLNWLKEQNIPILIGVDTRALTKVLRNSGVINGVMVFGGANHPIKFPDSMSENWVSQVSIKIPQEYGTGKYKIILVDCGLKLNILRHLLRFDATVKVVPFDYDYTTEEYDGVFLSNGPGDPKQCTQSIKILQTALQIKKPVYGICLGAQLMALAVGADTYKLKFGHRGQNQPCIDINSNKCLLTSQNHGYAIHEDSIPDTWITSFRHLNDNTVAGIKHKTLPFAAVQFHPEAAPGPEDTLFFFEQFIELVKDGAKK